MKNPYSHDMRNISGFIILVSILFIFISPLQAQNTVLNTGSGNVFSVGILGGFMYGDATEIVYQANPPINDNPYFSKLYWNFKPLVYFGAELGYSPANPMLGNGFNSSLTMKFGLPISTGIIGDFDWMDIGESFITHYSQHEAFSRSTFQDLADGYGTFTMDLSLGYSWALNNRIWIRPYGDFAFYRFSWKSMDGYLQYGNNPTEPAVGMDPWDPNTTPKRANYGPAIDYSQNWLIFAPGVSFGFNLTDYLNLSFYVSMTPLIYGYHRDDHLSPTKIWIYLDYVYGGLYINQKMMLEFKPKNNLSLDLSGSFMGLSGARGDNYTSKFGAPYIKYPGIAGAGFDLWDFTFSIDYTF